MTKLFNPKQVAESFSKSAIQYEQHALVQRDAEDELLDRIQLLNIEPKNILDVGCGTGTLARKLKKVFPQAKIYGVDLSEGMICEAKRHNGWFKKNYYQVAAAEALPFQDQSMDLIVSNFMLHWSNDIDAVFKEMNRILVRGAPVFMSTLGPDTLKELHLAWSEIDDKPHVHPFIDMHLLGDGLLRQGFKDPVVDRENKKVYFDELQVAVRSLKNIGAQNELSERRKTLTGKKRMQDFYQAYAEQKTTQGYPLTYELVYLNAYGGELVNQQDPTVQRFSLEDLKKTLPD